MEYVFTTWSILQQMKGRPIIHLQGDEGKTLCGLTVGIYWDFDMWLSDSKYHQTINCFRCIKHQQKKAGKSTTTADKSA